MQSNNNKSKTKKGFVQFFKDTFIPSKTDTKPQRTSKIIACITTVLIIAILITAFLIIRKYAVERIETDKNKDLINSSNISSQVKDEETTTLPVDDQKVELDLETGVSKRYVDLFKKNNDFIGWIKIEGTKLDQPVVRGEDNSFYLNKTLEKKHNAFGVPFADYRSMVGLGVQSDNITIYGHAAKDGTFFAPVKEYNDIEFYKKHPTITFNTIFGDGEYKIVSRFIEYVDPDNRKMFNYHDYVTFTDEQVYNKFVKSYQERSYFVAPVDVEFGDKFITLSTCNTEIVNSNKTPYRDVLIARKVRPGESKDVDVSKVTINKNQIMPDGWVKKFGKKNPHE